MKRDFYEHGQQNLNQQSWEQQIPQINQKQRGVKSQRFSHCGVWGESLSLAKNSFLPSHLEKPSLVDSLPHQIFISLSHTKFSRYNPIKTSFLAVVIDPVLIFILTSYSLYTQPILILILIDVPQSENVVFDFEKSSNVQTNPSSDSNCLKKLFPMEKGEEEIPPTP